MDCSLDYKDYSIAWLAVLPIEAEAALGILDKKHQGSFESVRGDDYIYIGGEVHGHNVVVATWPAGQNYGVGSAAALVNQVKARFSNIWFALLVGVAAGLPNLSPAPPAIRRDIRLGDVIVCLPEKASSGIIHYDLGKDTADGFLTNGRQAEPPALVRSAIGNIQLTKKRPFKTGNEFAKYLSAFWEDVDDDKFRCPSQEEDRLYDESASSPPIQPKLIERQPRDESERTRVWYGNIGSGSSMMRNARRRDELRDKFDLIGLEMEAAGIMNTLPTGVIRGVCDYGDGQKNKDWQPYAAAVAAVYAKGILYTISAKAAQTTKDRLEMPPRPLSLLPARRDSNPVGQNPHNDIPDPFVAEEMPIGTAFKLEIDEGSYAETHFGFSEGEVINSATNKCQGRACASERDERGSGCLLRAVYVCQECDGATYCRRCIVEALSDHRDYHKANHRLRRWRPVRLFRTPDHVVGLDPDSVVVTSAAVEKAMIGNKRYAKKAQRSSVLRLYFPAPKLDPSIHNCTKLTLDFSLDYLPIKYTNIWTLEKTVKMSMEKSGVVKVLVRRISLPTAPRDLFHSSNGYSERWRQNVKAKGEDQPHQIEMRIPPMATSPEHDTAIEVAIHFVQELTVVLADGSLLAPFQFKLRFISATMSTKDKIAKFVSPGEALQVERSEQNSDIGWEVVDDDQWDILAEDHQALGKKSYLFGDLFNDIRWFWGKDPIPFDRGEN